MKRIFSLFLCVIMLALPILSVQSFASYNSEYETKSDIVLLVSLDDGTVIFDKNSDKKTEAAALTKIVTLIVTLQNCPDLDTKVTVPDDDNILLKKTYSSNAGLKAGEEVTVRQLLYMMMVKSANDAANVLADYIGDGGVEAFVGKMNEFVSSVGCTSTHFNNPHGLQDEGQYTTANDLLKIVKAGLELPEFMEICNTYKYNMPATNQTKERNYISTNWMLNPGYKTYYYEYAQGIKSSVSSNDNRSIVVKAAKDGYNYLCIVLDAPYEDVNEDGNKDNVAQIEAKGLLKWTFKNIKLEKITDTSQIVTVVDVKLSFKTDHVRLVPKEDINALVPTGTDSNSVLIEAIEEDTPKTVYAPIKKGEVLGKAKIMYAGEQIATVDLVAAEAVSANVFLWTLNMIKNIITSPVFIVIAVLGIGFFIASRIRRNRRLEEHKRARYAPKMYKIENTKAKTSQNKKAAANKNGNKAKKPPQKRPNQNRPKR